MYEIKAIYNGSDFELLQPVPVEEDYEVIIKFITPVNKKQENINDYFNIWRDEDVIDIDELYLERGNFSMQRFEL